MRRVVGPTGGCGRQDVRYVADAEEMKRSSSEDEDFEAWEAYCEAEKKLENWGRRSGKWGEAVALKGGCGT